MDNYVSCDSLATLMEVVQGCVERGLTFKADTARLRVYLTGGY